MALTPEETIQYNTKRIELINTLIRPHVEERDRLTAEIKSLEEQMRKTIGDRIKSKSIEEQIPYYLDKETFRRNMMGVRGFFRSMGIDSGTCSASRDQVGLRIALNQSGSNIDQVYESLEMIIPHLKENHRGELASIEVLCMNVKNGPYISLTKRYGFWEVYAGSRLAIRSRNLKEMLEHISAIYYYLSIRDEQISTNLQKDPK